MDDHSQMVNLHGRIFQKVSVDERIYCVPAADDDLEEERLRSQHEIMTRLLGNSLVSTTVRLRDPRKVLECGYGGGDWCVQFAEEFEDCEVCSVRGELLEGPDLLPDLCNVASL
jgi:hypothetical protein